MTMWLKIVRTTGMVGVGIFFITLPYRLPTPMDWAGTVALVVPGMMFLYVEAYLWWRHFHASKSR